MKFAPTFSYLNDPLYLRMTLFNNDGTINEYRDVYSSFHFAIMYMELIKTCHYDMNTVITVWNRLWNEGQLDEFKKQF